MLDYYGMRRTGRVLSAKIYDAIWSMRGKFSAKLRWLRRDLIVTLDNVHARFPFEPLSSHVEKDIHG